jgi:hypothetical protein
MKGPAVLAFLRTLHVLSLAVWLGSVVFFTLAGLLIFRAFEEVSRLPTDNEPRPLWFPVPAAFQKDPPGEGFPDPLRLEQGSRAAGVAVAKVFPVYFALQAGCAVVAVLTALGLAWGRGGALNTTRVIVCTLGLATVLAGWWLEQRVHELRGPRNDLTDAVLLAQSPSPEQVEQARQARVTFGTWHGISLLDNFATLGLALLATLLAAHLPPRAESGAAASVAC